jgi:hypothetical protein
MKRISISILLVLALVTSTFATTSGPNGGSSFTQSADGNDSWTNLSNLSVEDGVSASCDLSSVGDSNTLLIKTFGFSTSGTINGIQVDIKHQSFGAVGAKDLSIKLLIAGVASGNNKASGTNWPNGALTYASYGNNLDLWGLSPTSSDINDSGFGVAIVVHDLTNSAVARIDYVRITITYTAAAGNPRNGDMFFSQTKDAKWIYALENLTKKNILSSNLYLESMEILYPINYLQSLLQNWRMEKSLVLSQRSYTQ